MQKNSSRRLWAEIALVAFLSIWLSGCAAALIAGGAVGGYAIAKDMEDGKLIDDPPKKQNKGWFGGNGS